MKNIKLFKYWYSHEFEKCLDEYGYTIDDVKGFGVSGIKQYHGNILKTYIIYIYDGESVYFSVVCFKSFDEYNKTWLGFNGDKLLSWYQKANIVKYKVKDIWSMNDRYVIAM